MTSTSDLVEEFGLARGQQADASWGARLAWQLTTAGLEAGEVDRVLESALAQVRDSQEPPEDLFGSADNWAAEQVTRLSEQGATFVDERTDANTFAVVSLSLAGVIALLFAVMLWFKYDDGAPIDGWLAATPVLLGAAPVLVSVVWERVVRDHPVWWATLAACASMVPSIGATTYCFLRGQGAAHRSPAWWVAEAMLLFGLAVLAGRFLPESSSVFVRARGVHAVADDEWLDAAKAALRERGDLGDVQVSEMLEEARTHAAQTGSPLVQEFGNPVGYARQLPGDQAVRHFRKALLNSFLVLCWVVITWGEWTSSLWGSAWRAAALALFVWESARNWVGWYRVRAARR